MKALPTPPSPRGRRAAARAAQAVLGAGFAAAALLLGAPSQAALAIGNNPLYLVLGKANVLIVLDNSNSMDEAPNGQAVGSDDPASKSEIARGVVRNLTDTYRGRVSMGLMAYRQNTPTSGHLHNSQYDVGYDPSLFIDGWGGARSSATKGFRIPNPTSSGHYIHYNVALPFYDTSSQGDAFCYSRSANAGNDFKDSNGTDSYRCFRKKSGPSNALPTDGTSEAAAGYSSYFGAFNFSPTDSDYAQGITDFGRFMTWTHVGPTWYRNDSPGRGFLHVPLGDLDSTQAAAIRTKLVCNVPDTAGCNDSNSTSSSIYNAGLTPIEGTLLTAKDYFGGSWRTTGEGYTSRCYPLPTSCGKDFVVLLTDGLPSNDKDGRALSNPETAITAAAAAAATLKTAGVETYVIGFALPYGTDKTRTLDRIAASGGTTTSYDASNEASLQAAFDAIFEDILRKTSAFGSVAQNSASLSEGTLVYQGRFDSTDWSGEVQALRPQADGSLLKIWSTDDAGRMPAAGARKIYTRLGGTGAELLYSGLSAAEQGALTTALASTACSSTLTGAACAQARVDWLRGGDTFEGATAAAPLRVRSRKLGEIVRRRVLGDIISSAPAFVKASDTIFVGANDGMLHAFSASTGHERFAYIPGAVLSGLYRLTTPNYAHEYFVDGEITISTTAQTAGRNILVGTLGRGGKALYALDVTNPASFGKTNVMWEFTDADLGLVLGKPFIAKLNNGRTAVILGNGPNSTNERSVLFVVDIETGALIRKIDTRSGSGTAHNGLSSPRGWDSDGNGTVDIVYAGDLLGNVWKFDLSASDAASWGAAFGTSSAPLPLFVAVDAAGNPQPITGMPSVGLDARKGDPNIGKRFVFVGTGRYLTSGDVTSVAVQSWYGLIDDVTPISGRSVLKQRKVEVETTVSGSAVRAFSMATSGDMAGRRGWYVDLKTAAEVARGERMVGEQKYVGLALLATSLIPDADQCKPGGTGYLNAIDPFTGAALATPFFSLDNDATFDDDDRIGTVKRSVGSIDPGVGLPSDGILLTPTTKDGISRVACSGTSGAACSVGANTELRIGRISWREVVNR